MSAPILFNLSPSPSAGAIEPGAAITFAVGCSDPLRDCAVFVTYPGSPVEDVAWDGAQFTPFFVQGSTVVASAAGHAFGLTFSLLRAGGWLGAPILTVRAVSTAGLENA